MTTDSTAAPQMPHGAPALDVGNDAVMNLATTPGASDASGNPGGNAPGAGSLGSGDAGITLGDGLNAGTRNPDNVTQTGQGAVGAGGMGGTGLMDIDSQEDADDRAAILGGDRDVAGA